MSELTPADVVREHWHRDKMPKTMHILGDEHVWRPTGFGGGSATSGRTATTFHHEVCIVCGATRRVDFPPPDDPKETTT